MENAAKPKKKKLTKILLLGTILASLGSFQHGYTLWIIHNPKTILVPNINSTVSKKFLINYDETLRLLLTLTVIMYPAGGMVGSLLLRPMTDNCGRKGALLLTNALAVISTLLQGLSRAANLYNFNVFARFVTGMYSGVFSGIVPLYIGEIAPTNLRGALVVVSVLFLTAGVAVGQVLCLPEVLANKKGMPFLVSFSGVIALFTGPLLLFSPASPRFLFIQKNNKEEARKALQKLRELDDVEDEMEELQEEDLCEAEEKHMTVFKLLNFQPLRKNLIYVMVVMGGHQLAGINGAYFYAETIFTSLSIVKIRSDVIAICTIFSLLLVILITMYAIDTVGRRFLLLMGFLVCSMSSILLTLSLELQSSKPWMSSFSTFLVITFIFGHLVGPASIPYVLAVEMFLQSSRASAFAIGGIINWMTRLLAIMIFLLIEPLIGSYSLLIFWPFCVATFIFSFINIPETKQKTFVQIHKFIKMRSMKKKTEVETE